MLNESAKKSNIETLRRIESSFDPEGDQCIVTVFNIDGSITFHKVIKVVFRTPTQSKYNDYVVNIFWEGDQILLGNDLRNFLDEIGVHGYYSSNFVKFEVDEDHLVFEDSEFKSNIKIKIP